MNTAHEVLGLKEAVRRVRSSDKKLQFILTRSKKALVLVKSLVIYTILLINKNLKIPEAAKEDWNRSIIIEKYDDNERRYKNKTAANGETWQLFLCNYDNCNDHEFPDPATTTTEKPSSSSVASISLPLLMFAVLASILTV